MEKLKEKSTHTDTLVDTLYHVVLFNDEVHSFDEVIGQIIKAIRCDQSTAERLTHEVHTKGKAIVFYGAISECIVVSGVLEEIALRTQISTKI